MKKDITTLTDGSLESHTLTAESISKAVDDLKRMTPKDYIEMMRHNCDMDELAKKLGVKVHKADNWSMAALYGMRVVKDPDMPKGEIHMVDNKGKIVNKFKI